MKKEQIYVVIDNEEKRLRAIQILRDAKERIFPGSDIFSEKSYNKCLEFYDNEWIVSGCDDKDILIKTEITLNQLERLLNPNFVVKEVVLSIDELQKQAESLGFELVKKERKIKVGDFGKFWDDDNECAYGFITQDDKSERFRFECNNFTWWHNFAHLTDEEKKQIQENW